MRITTSMYYNNMYTQNNRVNEELFDVNKQIASGLQIQYAYEDTDTFIKTMRLDDEITTLEQIQKSAESALKYSTNTDTTLNEFTTTLQSFKVKLIEAANSGVSSESKLQAIADDLESMRSHLVDLANTSVNGQFLFSGTAISTKPVNGDGSYNGNDESMTAFLGSGVSQAYNITGSALLYGEERGTNRQVTTNVQNYNLSTQYPAIMGSTENPDNVANSSYLLATDTIRDMMGDTDDVVDTGVLKHNFYISGTTHDGTAFKQHITMSDDQTVGDLMTQIGSLYGNSATGDVVSVSLNEYGEIEIYDKLSGSSKLDFHMVGATDFAGGAEAVVTDIDDLDTSGTTATVTTDFAEIAAGTKTLYVKEFVKSGLTSEASASGIEGLVYDRTQFEKTGPSLTSNASQIVTSDNSYAVDATRLGAVASGTTYDELTGYYSGLDGKVISLTGTDIYGNAYDLDVTLSDGGSTVTVNTANGVAGGTTFNLEDAAGAATNAGDVTYRQLMDVVNMAVTNEIPGTLSSPTYTDALNNSGDLGSTYLDVQGRIAFTEQNATTTSATISMYDSVADDFSGATPTASVMTFNVNNALTVSDPKTDFFAVIDEAIEAVRSGKFGADALSGDGDPRNAGIDNAIQKLDDLMDHVGRQHTKAGSQSLTMEYAIERTESLVMSSVTLRSDVIDTDVAEASLRLQQLSLNMQAIYSLTSKVANLSLVNYL